MSLSTRAKSFVAVAGGLASIATLLLALMTVFPSRYTVPNGGVRVSEGFTIERLTVSSGVQIVPEDKVENAEWKQGLFSGSSILTGSGELQLSDEKSVDQIHHIWVILLDGYGRVYLQYPPARLSASHWSVANIRLGREIAEIEFWGVNDKEHQALQDLANDMIKNRSCPPQTLEKLPAHSVLGSVDLLYRKGFLAIF